MFGRKKTPIVSVENAGAYDKRTVALSLTSLEENHRAALIEQRRISEGIEPSQLGENETNPSPEYLLFRIGRVEARLERLLDHLQIADKGI